MEFGVGHNIDRLSGVNGSSTVCFLLALTSLFGLVAAVALVLDQTSLLFVQILLAMGLAMMAIAYFLIFPRTHPDRVKSCITWTVAPDSGVWWQALSDSHQIIGYYILFAALFLTGAGVITIWFPGLAVVAILIALAAHIALAGAIQDYKVRIQNMRRCIG